MSYSSQFTQYTGLSFARVGEGSAKVALSAYEDSDVSVLHVRLSETKKDTLVFFYCSVNHSMTTISNARGGPRRKPSDPQ